MNLVFRVPKRVHLNTVLTLAFVFLAAMNVINRYYYFVFMAAIIFFVKPGRKIHLDLLPALLLFVLGMSWAAFSPVSTISVSGVIKPFTYLLCYIMGYSLLDSDRAQNSKEKTAFRLFYLTIFSVALGTFVHYLLNWFTNLDASVRNTVDFWSKNVMAATGQASLACLPLAIAVAMIFSGTKKRAKIIAWATLVLIMLYNLILSGRTLFIIALVTAGIAFCHRFLKQKKDRWRIILIVLLLVFALVTAYNMNLFGVKSFVEDSLFYERFFGENNAVDLDEDTRIEKKLYHLQNMDRFLWGGAHIREERGHAHDILLDTYDEAGIFAFIAMIAYIALSVRHLIQCLKDKTLPFVFQQVVLCIYAVSYLEFCIEPILQGVPWFFAAFCLIDGYVNRIVRYRVWMRKKGVVYAHS